MLPAIYVDIDELIYPHRKDIEYREGFIKEAILSRSKSVEDTDYYQFLVRLNTYESYIQFNVHDTINHFIKLYDSINTHSYKPREYGYIKIVRNSSKLRMVYPSHDTLKMGQRVSNKYILLEGAHRLAIMKSLNQTQVMCKRVYLEKYTSSDYTSFIESEEI